MHEQVSCTILFNHVSKRKFLFPGYEIYICTIIFRFLGFQRSVVLDRRKLVGLLDLYTNKTISWDIFVSSVQEAHKNRIAQPSCRQKLENKPKEEDYFYANPHECLANSSLCI
jgi:hypothetical protein